MDVTLQCEQQIGEQSLVHARPFELGDAEHCGSWAGAELSPLFLRHGRPPKAEVHAYVPFHLSDEAAVQTLTGDRLMSKTAKFSIAYKTTRHTD